MLAAPKEEFEAKFKETIGDELLKDDPAKAAEVKKTVEQMRELAGKELPQYAVRALIDFQEKLKTIPPPKAGDKKDQKRFEADVKKLAKKELGQIAVMGLAGIGFIMALILMGLIIAAQKMVKQAGNLK